MIGAGLEDEESLSSPSLGAFHRLKRAAGRQAFDRWTPCSPVVKSLGRHVQQYSVTFAVAGVRFEPQPGRVRLLKELFSNNSYAHDDQGDNPGQETEGSTVSSINCDRSSLI